MDHFFSRIEELRYQILEGYTEGFPILKELVQNAEDAKASCLDYGWLPKLPKANHPLLQTPLLFFINNGKFDEDDAEGLFYFKGISSKSDQKDTIGKFGLGLKSVFHLCEAFFYLAPELENCEHPNCNIFNPWKSITPENRYIDTNHDHWDDFSKEDQENIINYFKHKNLNTDEYRKKWFILLIPLRQESHQTKKTEDRKKRKLGTIYPKFFGNNIPNFLLNYNDFEKIGSVLPNLHNLKIVRYWEDEKIKFQANLINSDRLSTLEQLEKENSIIFFKGEIAVKNKAKENHFTNINYVGNEIILENRKLFDILENPQLNDVENTEKIKAHCAVIFTRNCQNLEQKSFLILRLATFLPLPITKEEDELKVVCNSKYSYNVTLHGYFFVDFARTGITGWDNINLKVKEIETDKEKSRKELETEWNFILYDYLLSQILETLSKFAAEYNLPPLEIEAICQSLKCSDLFKNNLSAIYRQYKYICRITLDGEKWELINIDERVLTLPDIPDWDVFTKLADLSSKVYFTLEKKPNLCLQNKPDQWKKSEILEIISNLDDKKFFSQSKYIDYLTKLIKRSGWKEDNDVQAQLITLVKKGLSSENIDKKIQESMQSLISVINPDRRFKINGDSYIFKLICDLNLSILLIYQSFEPTNQSKGKLSSEDTKKLLNCILDEFEEANDDKIKRDIYKFIQEIFKSSTNKKELRSNFEKSNFILVYNYKEQKDQWYSPESLRQLQEQKSLFKKGKDKQIVKLLQKTFPDIKLILTAPDTAESIFDKGELPECSLDECLDIVKTKPNLVEQPEQRLDLLKYLLKELIK